MVHPEGGLPAGGRAKGASKYAREHMPSPIKQGQKGVWQQQGHMQVGTEGSVRNSVTQGSVRNSVSRDGREHMTGKKGLQKARREQHSSKGCRGLAESNSPVRVAKGRPRATV